MAEVGGIARERLKSFVERIENLEEEKSALTADIREIYSEAKGIGLDIKTLRQIVRLRKLDSSDRQQQEELLDPDNFSIAASQPLVTLARNHIPILKAFLPLKLFL